MSEYIQEFTTCKCGTSMRRIVFYREGHGKREDRRIAGPEFKRCAACAAKVWQSEQLAKEEAVESTNSTETDAQSQLVLPEPSDPRPPGIASRVFGLGWRSRWPSGG